MPGRPCANRLCALPVAQRGFSRVDAVAVYSGALKDKIHQLKYDGAYGWAMIFGRLLVGWMESHPEQMRGVDHVVGNPTHTGRQPFQHIEAIMDAAYTEDVTRAFPLSPLGGHRLVKGRETPRSANRSLDDKRAAAAAHAAALTWTGDTRDIKGATIVLVDDVFTSWSHSDSGHPAPPTSADSSLHASPGAADPAALQHPGQQGRGGITPIRR
jgi:predicted amidophosphoribosyltransferase